MKSSIPAAAAEKLAQSVACISATIAEPLWLGLSTADCRLIARCAACSLRNCGARCRASASETIGPCTLRRSSIHSEGYPRTRISSRLRSIGAQPSGVRVASPVSFSSSTTAMCIACIAAVGPQAIWSLQPQTIPGSPGTVAPAASNSGQCRCAK